jgi:L-malate glycosyltransferase
LFLSSWYPSRKHSTLGNFVQRHAEAIAQLHYVHAVYVTIDEDAKQDFEIVDSTQKGVQQTIVYCKKGMLNWYTKWCGFKKAIAHLQQNNRFDFDLVHHNVIWSSGWQPLWLNWKFRLPYIITEHFTIYDTKARQDQPFFLRLFSRIVAKNASAICPVSQNLADTMQHFGLKGQYIPVYNVVDTTLFNYQEKTSSNIQFLHVSSLWDKQKNISGILRAWKKASDKNSNIYLNIGGDGDIIPWQQMANDLGIRKESISFFSEKTPAEIAALMQDSHCLILFSRFENLPVVIVEAMASGMAIISTRVGGIAEHIQPKLGYLIAPDNEQELENAMLHYASNRQDFDSSAMRSYALEHFDNKSVAKKFTDVYHLILEQGIRVK